MAQINIKEAICEAIRQTVAYIKGKAVTSEVQNFTDEEKAQIRANIGVTSDGNADTSGITAEINTLTSNISNLKENVTPVRKFYGTTNTAITEQVKVVTIEDTDFPTSVSDYYEGMRLSVKFTQNCNGTLSNTSTIKLQINGTARYVRDRDGGVTVSKAGISFGSNKYVDFVWDGIDAWVCYDVSEAHTEDMRMSTSSTKCKYNNLPATRDDVNNVYDLIKPVQMTENVIFYTTWSGATIVLDKIYQNVPMVTAYVDTTLSLVTNYNPEVRIVGVTNTAVMIVYKASSEKSFDIKINVIGY